MKSEKSIFLVSDLDGTFLDEKGKPHPKNVEAIKRLRQEYSNCKIAFATGTGPDRAMKYVKECNFIDYLICYNGGSIFRILNNKPEEIHKSMISKADAESIIKIVDSIPGAELQIYNSKHEKILGKEKCKKIIADTGENITGKDFLYKAIIIPTCENKEIDNIIRKLIINYPHLEFTRSKLSKTHEFSQINPDAITIEINPCGISKGEALEYLCDNQNIDKKTLVVVGDELNDTSMFLFAKKNKGAAIAVKNANPHLKAIATDVTNNDNNQGAVAEVVQKYVFKSEQYTEEKVETLVDDKIEQTETNSQQAVIPILDRQQAATNEMSF